MLGVIGVLIAIALLIFMAYKGWGIIPASLICSIIVLITNQGDLWEGLAGNYINGFIYFAGSYFLIFVLGALFGQVMGESGSAKAISYKLLDWFGEKRAILVVTLATAILTYGGVNLFIVIFTVYPLALILFKAANLPKRLIAASVGLGAATLTMTCLPGSPAIQNLIPAQVLGTTATAAPLLGIICGLLILVLGLLYIHRQARMAQEKGDGFVPSPSDNIESLELTDRSELPDWRIAFIPLIMVIVIIFLLKNRLDAIYGVAIALTIGVILTYILNWKRFKSPLKALNEGCSNSIMALINTSAVVGFGFVVQNVPAFQSFVKFALGLKFHPFVSEAIAVNIIAGITGSASGGLTIFMTSMGEAFLATGVNPEALHRIASIASGGLDSLPHSGAVVTLLMVMGLTHKEGYKDLGFVTTLIPLLVTVVAVILGVLFY